MCVPAVFAVGCLRSLYGVSGVVSRSGVSGAVCIMNVVNGVICGPVVLAVRCSRWFYDVVVLSMVLVVLSVSFMAIVMSRLTPCHIHRPFCRCCPERNHYCSEHCGEVPSEQLLDLFDKLRALY